MLDPLEMKRQDFLERDDALEGGARMFYAGEVPWHGLGKGVVEAVTSGEAIQLAGLNLWNIHNAPVYDPVTAEWMQAVNDEWCLIKRGMDNRVLGMGRPSYKPIQNEQCFDFLDSLVQDGIVKYHTAGSLKLGKWVWILAKLPNGSYVGDDLFEDYILLKTGHDSNTSLTLYPTKVRVVCNNTLTRATRGIKPAVRISHFGDIDRKFDLARNVLNITTESMRALQEWMEKLAAKRASEDQVVQVRDAIFGSLDDQTPTRRKTAIERWMAIYEAEKEREGRTFYTVLNTVTGFADHVTATRKNEEEGNVGEERLISFLGGSIAGNKEKGIIALSKIGKIPAPAGMF